MPHPPCPIPHGELGLGPESELGFQEQGLPHLAALGLHCPAPALHPLVLPQPLLSQPALALLPLVLPQPPPVLPALALPQVQTTSSRGHHQAAHQLHLAHLTSHVQTCHGRSGVHSMGSRSKGSCRRMYVTGACMLQAHVCYRRMYVTGTCPIG